MKIFASLFVVGLAIAGIFALLWFFMPSFSTQFEPPKIIQVKEIEEGQESFGVARDIAVQSIAVCNLM